MKLSEMKETLASGQIQLTKSLGQNFLHDANQLRRIVSAAEIGLADNVLEIGPGLGPLTELLLEKAGRVLAIEKDRRLYDLLLKRLERASHLELLHDDALDYVRENKRDWTDWKLVANLPYSVASPILVELAEAPGIPSRMVVTLQFEVARRIMSKAGDDDYGILTLLLQLRYLPVDLFRIPRTCFFPAPEIDSACVTLLRRPEPLLSAGQSRLFTRIVKRGFSQRRKMMLKLLKQDWPAEKLTEAFARLELSPKVRAEEVSLEKFAELAKRLG